MTGMVVAAELDSARRKAPARPDTAVLSYEPGTVDTAMQEEARSRPLSRVPVRAAVPRLPRERRAGAAACPGQGDRRLPRARRPPAIQRTATRSVTFKGGAPGRN